ncbi:MAG: hypothetical protein SFU86_22610 [Pirellulaceae bacterium]|nr:hypothetical protein [Pirellulaceae bacterium]
MDLFAITCTTCKSRLKVREEGAIGQILACPKCGGMVMVKPPPGWEPGKPPALPAAEPPPGITAVVEVRRSEETLGDSQFDAVEDLLSDAPPKQKARTVTVAEGAPGLVRPRFVGAPPQTTAKPPVAPLPAVAQVEGAKSNGHPLPTAELPNPDWSNARPWRYWLLLAAAVVAGVGLAISIVIFSISFLRGDDPDIVQVVMPPNPPATVTPEPTPATPRPASPVAPPVQPAIPMPAQPVENPAAPALPPPANPPLVPAVAPPAEPMEPMPAQPANPPKPDNRTQFDRILGGDQFDAVATETPRPMPPPMGVPMAPAEPAAPERPALPRPQPRLVDVAARLADPISGIESEGTPLVDFLQVISELSTAPITLEPDHLLAIPTVRASAIVPVRLKVEKSTVSGVLAAGLAPLGLECIVRDEQLVVRIKEPEPPPTVKYPVKDLTGSDETQAAELAELLQEIVEPASWGAGGGTIEISKDELKITQRRAVHAQLFILGEKLRTARRLPAPPYLKNYDPALASLATRGQRAAPKLPTPVTLNFSQPTPLPRILARLEQAAGVRILVDWLDVARAGWNPDGEATLVADKLPLGAALEKLLGPMDLAWRVVDGTTLQVLTPQALAERMELEVYPVGPLVADDPTGQALLTRLRQELGEKVLKDDGGQGEIRFDLVGRCLIASLPQPQQQRLEGLLASLAPPPAAK